MLSRRHIRIKVFHALYSHVLNGEIALNKKENNLHKSISDIYRLYLFELQALMELLKMAEDKIERNKNKKLPTAADLQPNRRFVENRFLQWLSQNESFQKQREEHHVAFYDQHELLRPAFRQMEQSDYYQLYMSSPQQPDWQEDKKLIKIIYARLLTENEDLHQFYEEQSLHWADDLDAAQMMVAKTLKTFSDQSGPQSPLVRLIKNQSDLEFGQDLFRHAVSKWQAYDERIRQKARNWETERIALVDSILMKMAITEMVVFQEIPIKVTLNEYIELSKEYSTPKSSNFINGILDKIQAEMVAEGEIVKIGRGLL